MTGSATAVPAVGASSGATLAVVAAAVAVGAIILIGGGVVLGVVLAYRFDARDEPSRPSDPVVGAWVSEPASEFAPRSYDAEELSDIDSGAVSSDLASIGLEELSADPRLENEPDANAESPGIPANDVPAGSVPNAGLGDGAMAEAPVDQVEPNVAEEPELPTIVEEIPYAPTISDGTLDSNVLALVADLPWIEKARAPLPDPVTLVEPLAADEIALELVGPAALKASGEGTGFYLDGMELRAAWIARSSLRSARRETVVGNFLYDGAALRFAWSETLRASDDFLVLDERRRLLNSLRLRLLAITVDAERFYLPLMNPIPIEAIAVAPPGSTQQALPDLDLELPEASSLFAWAELENYETIEPMSYADEPDEAGGGGSLTVSYDDETGAIVPLIACRYEIDEAGNGSIGLKIETVVRFDYVPQELRSSGWKPMRLWKSAATEIERLRTTLARAIAASEEQALAVSDNVRLGYAARSELEAELESRIEAFETAQRIASVQQDLLTRLEADPLRARIGVAYRHNGEQAPPVTIYGVPSAAESSDSSASIFGDR